MQQEINKIDLKELNISFIATFSQGLFAISMLMLLIMKKSEHDKNTKKELI